MPKKGQIVFKRHGFWWKILLPVGWIASLVVHHKNGKHFKIKKGEQYIILSNHQTDLDPLLLGGMFNRPFCILATDSFFSQGLLVKMLRHAVGLISKKKGTVDVSANMNMVRCIREGGSLLFYPEGNRTYAEFQFPFTEGFGKFIRYFKKPIIIVNTHGGTGCSPRWGKERRKGPYYTEIKRVIKPEEYEKYTDEEFEKILADELRVFDSESGNLYKSDCKAEYLERMLFVCPKCGKVETLVSKGDHLYCKDCGLDVEYTEDLHLVSKDKDFKFTKLVDWYNFQINFVKNYKLDNDIIFSDDNVKLYISNPGTKRQLIQEGKLTMDKDKFVFGNFEIKVSDIEIASPISGTKFNFSTGDQNYYVIGGERFNPLKYVLMLHKVDSKMKENNSDIYYCLEERN